MFERSQPRNAEYTASREFLFKEPKSPAETCAFKNIEAHLVDFAQFFDNNCSVDLQRSAMISFSCINCINGEISLVKIGRGPQVAIAMDPKMCTCYLENPKRYESIPFVEKRLKTRL